MIKQTYKKFLIWKIKKWLSIFKIENYTINDDLTVDVKGNVDLFHKKFKLRKLIFQFGIVTGDFCCSFHYLKTLKGCPREVGGSFDVGHNELKSLEFFPKKIGKNISVAHNRLISLKGIVNEVNGYLTCSFNNLTSLNYFPLILRGDLDCSGNKLTSLEGITQKINGDLDCSFNQLTSIDCKEIKGSLNFTWNTIKTFNNMPELINGNVYCYHNPFEILSIKDLLFNVKGNIYSTEILLLELENFYQENKKNVYNESVYISGETIKIYIKAKLFAQQLEQELIVNDVEQIKTKI